jgi:lysophospholipase L1-like esterase
MKEQFEWIHSWCDNAPDTDKKRVLLLGDSITYGYQGYVRGLLSGKCYTDCLALSYSMDEPVYTSLVRNFVNDSKYDGIHFNFGLHGFHMEIKAYRIHYEKMLKFLVKRGTVILANSTLCGAAGNPPPNPCRRDKLGERNKAVGELAAKYGLRLNDLFALSRAMPEADRADDGIHYRENGYRKLAEAVAKNVGINL